MILGLLILRHCLERNLSCSPKIFFSELLCKTCVLEKRLKCPPFVILHFFFFFAGLCDITKIYSSTYELELCLSTIHFIFYFYPLLKKQHTCVTSENHPLGKFYSLVVALLGFQKVKEKQGSLMRWVTSAYGFIYGGSPPVVLIVK